MIEEPPLLTVKRPSRRPTPEQVAAFAGVPTSFVVDALQGGHALDPAIRPVGEDRGVSVAGPALTADSGPGDVLALLAALRFVSPGDVLVNAVGGHRGCAALGDRVAAFARNAGAAAVVTDGPARDSAGILETGLPVWCAGLNPDTPFGKGPGKVGTPVQVGGRHVEAGDMVVADFDGVVVVPFDRIDDAIAALETVRELEGALDAELRNGLKVPPDIEELLDGDQVRYVE